MQKEPGLWSAFWIMSPTMGNPLNDPGKAGTEIDVFEYLAVNTNQVRHNVHWDGYEKKFHKMDELVKKVPGLSQGFHTYAVRWDAAGHVFYTDGIETGRSTNAPVSNRSQFLILSCEVESWAGDIRKANCRTLLLLITCGSGNHPRSRGVNGLATIQIDKTVLVEG